MTASGARPMRSTASSTYFRSTLMKGKLKSECRNPKTEGNPKSEARIPNAFFGFRPSGFLRTSDFGFWVSWLCGPRLLPLAQAPHIRQAPQINPVLRECRAGMKLIAHLGAKQFLEMPRGLAPPGGS